MLRGYSSKAVGIGRGVCLLQSAVRRPRRRRRNYGCSGCSSHWPTSHAELCRAAARIVGQPHADSSENGADSEVTHRRGRSGIHVPYVLKRYRTRQGHADGRLITRRGVSFWCCACMAWSKRVKRPFLPFISLTVLCRGASNLWSPLCSAQLQARHICKFQKLHLLRQEREPAQAILISAGDRRVAPMY